MSKRKGTKGDQCAEWLLRLLADSGPLKPQAVVELGKKAGYTRSMIYRVQDRLAGQIGDVHGHMHPGNLWLLDPHYVPGPRARSADDQLAELRDWLAEHDYDTYWSTPGLDTGAKVIVALERKLSRGRLIEMLAIELGVTVEIIL